MRKRGSAVVLIVLFCVSVSSQESKSLPNDLLLERANLALAAELAKTKAALADRELRLASCDLSHADVSLTRRAVLALGGDPDTQTLDWNTKLLVVREKAGSK